MMVSIIIPCYNKAEYLRDTLDSVLNQDFSEWECIIVNDGSEDETDSIAEMYCTKDTRFKYIFQNNEGVSAARNNGIRMSSGKYILPLDADDLVSNNFLREAVTYMENNQCCKLVYPLVEYFGEKDGLYELPEYSFEKELWVNLLVCSSLYKRLDYDKTTGYNTNMKSGYEDWDFWLSLLTEDDEVKRLDSIRLYYRQLKQSRNREAGKNEKELNRQIVHNHRSLYEPYLDSIISLHEENRMYKEHINQIEKSMSYKLGETLAKPYRLVRYGNK